MTRLIERLTTALSDRYRIERELGTGGMATVYLAHDLKHERMVAVKVLKPELAAVIGANRFVTEIKTTASLQHPHILPLFDSGESDGFLFYVMPFIDGETLRSKLDRETQFGVEESVRIASDIAEALQYAHTHGIVHRDIKPENILISNGRPMVADFGIALALSAAAGGRMTETGLSLGTPHYMSPEQATAEKEIGARADIYSLASVLYEMLTGEPPHMGNSAQQIIMKIITETPQPVTTLRKSVPANVAAAVAKALEKLPADRFATAGEFAAALNNPAYGPRPSATGFAGGSTPQDVKRTRRLLVALSVATIAFAGIAASSILRAPAAKQVVRYSMGIPATQSMRQGFIGINIAISPDGKRFVYVGQGDGGGQLWVRERDKLDATPIAGTIGASNPYFSPDGKRIAFSAGPNFELRIVSVAGGPPITLTTVGPGSAGGGTWSEDGWIYFDSPGGLSRIKADGGTPELFLPLDSAKKEIGHAWPSALPNGGLIYRSRRTLDPADFDIIAFDPRKHERRVLLKALIARYVEPGLLVFLRADGVVMAAPFDIRRFRLTGPAVPLFQGVMTKPFGSADIAISASGTLMYLPGNSTMASGVAEIVQVTRAGVATPLSPPVSYNPSSGRALSLSPDGTRLAYDDVRNTAGDIWVRQLPSGSNSRLTFTKSGAVRPNWTSDGRYVTYLSAANDGLSVAYKTRADGGGAPELVLQLKGSGVQEAVLSRDEAWIIYRMTGRDAKGDIFAMRTNGDTTKVPLLTSPTAELGAQISPDGKWLAYTSDESGQLEIFVRPFPNTSGGRWQISRHGGIAARWSHSGRELFFGTPDGDFMAAPVAAGATFMPGEPQRLFPMAGIFVPSLGVPLYDVMPDDNRFIMVRYAVMQQNSGAGEFVVVDNWAEELKAKMKK